VAIQRRGTCLSRPGFFGLTHDYMRSVYEAFFHLKNAYNWSLAELYSLPVALRRWFIDMYVKKAEKEKEENNEYSTN